MLRRRARLVVVPWLTGFAYLALLLWSIPHLFPAPAEIRPAEFSLRDGLLLGAASLAAAHLLLVLPAEWLASRGARWRWLPRAAPVVIVMGITMAAFGARPANVLDPIIVTITAILAGVPVLLMGVVAWWLLRRPRLARTVTAPAA